MRGFNKRDFTIVPSRQARIGLPANQQVVYMWLAEHSDDNNQSFPSRKVLAFECGMSPATLDRSLIELEKRGFIIRESRYVENKQSTNLYTVLIVTKGHQNDEHPLINMMTPPHHIDEQNPTHLTQPIINPLSTNVLVDSAEPNATEPKPDLKIFFYMLVKALGFSETVRFTDGRKRKLALRLRAYTGSELLLAATNLGGDAYMQGENQGGKRYGDIDYFLRNDEIVDKYRNKNKLEFSKGAF